MCIRDRMEGILEWDDSDTAAIRSVTSPDDPVRCVNVSGMEAKLRKQRIKIGSLQSKLGQGSSQLTDQKKLVAKMTKSLRENDEKTAGHKQQRDEACSELKDVKEQLKAARKSKERAQEELAQMRGSGEASKPQSAPRQACTGGCAEGKKQTSKYKKLHSQHDGLQAKHQKLEAEHSQLKARLEALRVDSDVERGGVPQDSGEMLTDQAPAPATKGAQGSICELNRQGQNMELVVRLGEGSTIDFMPGQHSELTFLGSHRIDASAVNTGLLSFMSTPDELPVVRFSLQDSPHNPASFRNFVFHHAELSDRVLIGAGAGCAGMVPSMMPVPGSNMLFLGSGSGISPLLSVLKQSLQTPGNSGVMTLIHSVCSSVNVPLESHVDQLQQEHSSRFRVLRTATEPELEWAGRVGRVDAEMLTPFVGSCSMFFVSGSEGFVKAMVHTLLQLGVWAPRIRSDCFPKLQQAAAPVVPREKRRDIRREIMRSRASTAESTDGCEPAPKNKMPKMMRRTHVVHRAPMNPHAATMTEGKFAMRAPPGMLIQFGSGCLGAAGSSNTLRRHAKVRRHM
eukprot:TRINITY_DN16646_c0_g1_i1.p1 TRINITY_DN16646_c0_g1~~TRINITY_DN16646_c0_g1_i1.p1  ORF type:complete len:566 (-),score=110.78 TRINITY_DN16646_c0_g1_i1:26-1723(-)